MTVSGIVQEGSEIKEIKRRFTGAVSMLIMQPQATGIRGSEENINHWVILQEVATATGTVGEA